MRRHFSAWAPVGAIVFAVGIAWCEDVSVSLSSAALTEPTTGAALAVEEPFINPFGTKKPKIVSGFGKRDVPNQPMPEVHDGVDYTAPAGTVVRAARSGKVIFAGFSKMYVSRTDKTQQHRFVIVRHADGKSSRYVHLSVLRVRPGADIQAGQPLGVLAESDEWKTPVLHFEIRDAQGRAVDPKTMITEVKKP